MTTTIFFIYSCNCTESLPETYHVTVHIFLKEIYFKPIHRILSLDHTFFFCLFFFFSNFHFRFLCPLEVNQFQKKTQPTFFSSRAKSLEIAWLPIPPLYQYGTEQANIEREINSETERKRTKQKPTMRIHNIVSRIFSQKCVIA